MENRYEYVSSCCGSKPKGNGDCDSSDFGICSDCGEHCEYGYFDDYGNFFLTQEEAAESNSVNEQDLKRID